MKQFSLTYMKAMTLFLLLVICVMENAMAQFTKLHDFDSPSHSHGTGSNPEGSPTISPDGAVLYGTTDFGGENDNFGIVFRVNTDGSNFVKLVDFDGSNKGSFPETTLTLSQNGKVLYGATSGGGTNDFGVVFKVDNDGQNFKKLVDFDDVNKGLSPFGKLTLSSGDTVLYGVTSEGGANHHGVIYKVDIDGQNFKKLVDFDGVNKGSLALGNLVFSSDSMLYGTTAQGGTNNHGIIYKVKTDGSGFTKLLDFDGVDGSNQGETPSGKLILSGTVLYGVTEYGGSNNDGMIFKINTDGTEFKKLINFNHIIADSLGGTPVDITLSGTVVYGVTHKGGAHHVGIVYKVNTDGTSFTKLFEFDGGDKGSEPLGGLTYLDNILYGMAYHGGVNDGGVLFKYTLPAATGVPEYVPAGYKNRIYPNPFNDHLYVENEPAIIKKLELINVYGQVVKSVTCNATNVTINTSDLSPGMYIVKLYDSKGNVITNKMLRQ